MMKDAGRYPWSPDNGDGTFSNPIIHADYSDPDVIRVGDDFWMTASSFNCTPGLPILHSRDLVNWRLVNHAIRNVPHPSYTGVRIGGGVWAPAIRHHAGKFWIVFPMPDEGIYVTCADDPLGRWEEPWCLQEAKGWIDPCLFWDDDGQAYLAHAYAFSRSGLKERIHLRPMSPDARRLLGEGRELFHTPHHLYLEGPKIHKLNGWYYIMCPGGGVQTGWQVAFRSRDIWGPYEEKVVLAQGDTPINGPHQGALVDLADGSWWFAHFQDCGPFGRITHLQPVNWVDGWPLCGEVRDGVSQPVARWRKPVQGFGPEIPATSDDFSALDLNLQWQWQANHEDAWCSLTERPGWLRLFPQPGAAEKLTDYPRFVAQKFPARSFRVNTTLDLRNGGPCSIAGLGLISGAGAHFVGLRRSADGFALLLGSPTGVEVLAKSDSGETDLSVVVGADGSFHFLVAACPQLEARRFTAKEGGWIGAKVGVFHLGTGADAAGFADVGPFNFSS
jgi:beta-xylosidase